MLVDVVSKGGNLLLNIGPGPDGRWHDAAYDRLRELGAWLRVNGAAICGTRSMTPHASGRMRFTRGKATSSTPFTWRKTMPPGCRGLWRCTVCVPRPARG